MRGVVLLALVSAVVCTRCCWSQLRTCWPVGSVANAVGYEQAELVESGEHGGDQGAVCRDAFLDLVDFRTVIGCGEAVNLPQAGGGR